MSRNRNHARRNARRAIARKLRNGTLELRVGGSEKEGFRLGAVVASGFEVLGHAHPKQKVAVAVGERAFNQKAKKLLKAA